MKYSKNYRYVYREEHFACCAVQLDVNAEPPSFNFQRNAYMETKVFGVQET